MSRHLVVRTVVCWHSDVCVQHKEILCLFTCTGVTHLCPVFRQQVLQRLEKENAEGALCCGLPLVDRHKHNKGSRKHKNRNITFCQRNNSILFPMCRSASSLTDIFSCHGSLKGLLHKVAEHLLLFVTGAAEPNDFADLRRVLQSTRCEKLSRLNSRSN